MFSSSDVIVEELQPKHPRIEPFEQLGIIYENVANSLTQ